jgi:hypothetical protein
MAAQGFEESAPGLVFRRFVCRRKRTRILPRWTRRSATFWLPPASKWSSLLASRRRCRLTTREKPSRPTRAPVPSSVAGPCFDHDRYGDADLATFESRGSARRELSAEIRPGLRFWAAPATCNPRLVLRSATIRDSRSATCLTSATIRLSLRNPRATRCKIRDYPRLV